MFLRGWRRQAWRIAIALLALSATTVGAGNITVFAAASLKEALDGIAVPFERAKGDRLVISYAASSALARQIEAGAPADVFISADTDWMDYLAKRNLIVSATRTDLLKNALVLIAPADRAAPLEIRPGFPLAQALGGGRLAMADPDHVPAGKYGKAALEALGVWAAIEKSLARGEAPLGIVYRTDGLAEPKVRIVGVFPAGTHPPIVYPVAAVAGRGNTAAPLLEYLRSAPARAVFEKHGFTF